MNIITAEGWVVVKVSDFESYDSMVYGDIVSDTGKGWEFKLGMRIVFPGHSASQTPWSKYEYFVPEDKILCTVAD